MREACAQAVAPISVSMYLKLVPFLITAQLWGCTTEDAIDEHSAVYSEVMHAEEYAEEHDDAEESGEAEDDGSAVEHDTEWQDGDGEEKDYLSGDLLPECDLFAQRPYLKDGHIYGSGSWSGCPKIAPVTVLLRHYKKWWLDKTLASETNIGESGSVDLSYACGSKAKSIKVYIETRFLWKRVKSARTTVPCGK